LRNASNFARSFTLLDRREGFHFAERHPELLADIQSRRKAHLPRDVFTVSERWTGALIGTLNSNIDFTADWIKPFLDATEMVISYIV
jgi:hypothetical protein